MPSLFQVESGDDSPVTKQDMQTLNVEQMTVMEGKMKEQVIVMEEKMKAVLEDKMKKQLVELQDTLLFEITRRMNKMGVVSL